MAVVCPSHMTVNSKDFFIMSCSKSTIQLESLVENLDSVSASWKQLGMHLGFDMNDLDVIQTDGKNVAERFQALCAKWLQRNPSGTWDILIKALKKMKRQDVVEKIRDYLSATKRAAKPDQQKPKYMAQPQSEARPLDVPRSVVADVDRLQKKFLGLVCNIQVKLKHKDLSLECLELLAVFISTELLLNPCLKVDKTDDDKIHSLFISIEQHLNFFDTHLICGIDVNFLNGQLENDIDKYNNDIADFEKSTNIVKFKKAIEECAQTLDANDETSVQIILRLDRHWTKRTLQNLHHLIDHLFGNAALLKLISIHQSILTVGYVAPKSLLLYLIVLACKKRVGAFFAGVVSIQISRILLQKSRDSHVLSCLRRYGSNPSPSEAILSTKDLDLTMQDKSEVIKLLLLLGGNPDYRDRKTTFTPLFLSVMNNEWISLKFLLKLGANPNIRAYKHGYEFTPLYFASEIGNDICAKKLLDYGADPNVRKHNGVTPLFIASQRGNPGCCAILLQRGANPDLCNSDGCSPLYMACQDGHHECVKILLENKANHDLCQLQDGDSPLMVASNNGHAKCVHLLLEHNADPNAHTKDNFTALSCASQNGHIECVKLLLQYKADPNISRKPDGTTPLHLATQELHYECMVSLLKKKANPNCKMRHGNKITLPLFHAIAFDSLKAMKLLLSYGANPNSSGTKRMTSLHISIVHGGPKHVELLLANKANPNVQDEDGNTPLMFAAARGELISSKLLLDNQANPNIKNNHGLTALIRAVTNEQYDMVHLLLENKADPNDSSFPFNALDFACWSGNASITYLLIHNGANTYRPSNKSLLIKAITNYHQDVAEVLIKAEVDINARDEDGSTPIMHASFLGQSETVKMLADAGTDLIAENKFGYTAFDMAERRGHQDIMEILADRIYSKVQETQETSATEQSTEDKQSIVTTPTSEASENETLQNESNKETKSQLSHEAILNKINKTISQFKFSGSPQSLMEKYRLPSTVM